MWLQGDMDRGEPVSVDQVAETGKGTKSWLLWDCPRASVVIEFSGVCSDNEGRDMCNGDECIGEDKIIRMEDWWQKGSESETY